LVVVVSSPMIGSSLSQVVVFAYLLRNFDHVTKA
jgi:hypothetical protein